MKPGYAPNAVGQHFQTLLSAFNIYELSVDINHQCKLSARLWSDVFSICLLNHIVPFYNHPQFCRKKVQPH